MVHYEDRSILVEGIYIPAKETKTSIMVLPDIRGIDEHDVFYVQQGLYIEN